MSMLKTNKIAKKKLPFIVLVPIFCQLCHVFNFCQKAKKLDQNSDQIDQNGSLPYLPSLL